VKRGELVAVAMSGDFGKPRPALVVQSDRFEETGTVTVLLSGTLVDAPLIRLTIQPPQGNGLRRPLQVQVDKAMSVKRDKLALPLGCFSNRLRRNLYPNKKLQHNKIPRPLLQGYFIYAGQGAQRIVNILDILFLKRFSRSCP